MPTGWEITQDLIQKLARLVGDTPSDPISWYREKFEADPGYSQILSQLANAPADRSKLLQCYFEPTEDERAEGRKLPTAAHKAIADLVARGYIRVIVTTKFDRLLEQAMADLGVQPSVISSADAANGAMPLAHSRCTLIKVHGDYLDPRFRNTVDELNSYEPAIDRLLDQVFDEYGLIICGWSGDWDGALRSAIERCPSRRFTTFWTMRGKSSERARRVIEQRRAVELSITDADTFFTELRDSVVALETFAVNDPIAPKVAVARVKQYLSDPRYQVALHDLVTKETAVVGQRTNHEHFPLANENPTASTVSTRIKRYDSVLDLLLSELVCLGYWGKSDQQDLLVQCFRRIAEEQIDPELGMPFWLALKRYPALLLLYGIGIAAISHRNYDTLKRLYDLKIMPPDRGSERRVVVRLNDNTVIQRSHQQKLVDPAVYTWLSDHLFERLREPLAQFLPTEQEYEQTFAWFEYFSALASLEARLSLTEARALVEDEKARTHWIPVGRFGWKKFDLATIAEQELPGAIKAGFFGDDPDSARAKASYLMILADRFAALVRQEWRIWYW